MLKSALRLWLQVLVISLNNMGNLSFLPHTTCSLCISSWQIFCSWVTSLDEVLSFIPSCSSFGLWVTTLGTADTRLGKPGLLRKEFWQRNLLEEEMAANREYHSIASSFQGLGPKSQEYCTGRRASCWNDNWERRVTVRSPNHRVGDVAMSRFSDFNPTVLPTRLKLYPRV